MLGHLNSHGVVNRRVLGWILLVGAVVYLGYKLIPPAFAYHMLRYEVRSEAKNAHHYDDETIVKHILEKAEVWSVPLDRENILVERGLDSIKISVSYKVDINFFNRYKRTLSYDIEVVEPLRVEGRY